MRSSAYGSERGFTLARSSVLGMPSGASMSSTALGSCRSPRPGRCLSPPRFETSARARDFALVIRRRESSRGSGLARCSRSWTRVSAMTDAIQAPRPDDTNAPDEQKKVHRSETKTRTPAEAKREGPTLDVIKADERVKVFIRSANQQTGAIGYTEHGERHANTSADGARFILKSLGHDARRCEIAAVAAYLHDMGNVVTREKHAQTGALLAKDILTDLGFPLEEIATMMGAIANHEEDEGGLPVSAVSAAVIIADKSDVHRSRVRNPKSTSFDIHDRVNFAVTASEIKVSRKEKLITLELAVDTEVSPIMEYFEIFLPRMMLSRRAAEFLHCNFALVVNNTRLL